MEKLTNDLTFKFSDEERKNLITKNTLSIIQPDKHPLTKQEKSDIKIALTEDQHLEKAGNRLHADLHCRQLIEDGGCKDLALQLHEDIAPTNRLEMMLLDQMAAMHVHTMNMFRLAGGGDYEVDAVTKLIQLGAKLSNSFQKGMQTLNQSRNGGKQEILVKHQNVQINGGRTVITDELVNHSAGMGGE